MEKKTIYSYHTFLYPFLWNTTGSVEIQTIARAVETEGWIKCNKVTEGGQLSSVLDPETCKWTDQNDQRMDYQTFQYFTPSARKALFGADSDIVQEWLYSPTEVHNQGEYRIYQKGREQPYVLNINHIHLKLFNTGIGILIFELEYPMPEGGVKQARVDIRAINEVGRRIYPAFLPKEQEKYPDVLYAEKLEVKTTKIIGEELYNRSLAHFDDEKKNLSYLHDPEHRQNFIHQILFGEKNDLPIVPAVDDRMFVCCCVMDPEYTEHFLHGADAEECDPALTKAEREEWQRRRKNARMQQEAPVFRTDWSVGAELYAVTNVDLTDSSCQQRQMLDQYLDEQLYLRWSEIGYSTIYSITNHSMFCLTGDPEKVTDFVVNPFLIEYIQLCILVLAQRASLMSFDAQITQTIADLSADEKKITRKLLDLAKRYAVFQGEILIPEATSQIQGIELYERLQKMLFIEKLHGQIRQQMDTLFQVSEYTQDRLERQHEEEMKKLAEDQKRQQKQIEWAFALLALLSIISAWDSGYTFFSQLFDNNGKIVFWLWLLILAGVCLFVFVIFRKSIRDWWTQRNKRGDEHESSV